MHRMRILQSFFIILFIPAVVISDLAADRTALLVLRDAVRGRTLRWNVMSLNPCSWKGVECNETTNRVTALRLPGNELSGKIPENTIGNMTELRVLSLRENLLSGQIPSDLGSCTLLTSVHLQGNRFSGEIPASFFRLKNLVRLDVARNGLSGNLSAAFDDFTLLKILLLESNQFTGSLPDLRNLVRLRSFNVSFNVLNGSIPSSIARFSAQSFIGTSLCGRPLLPCAAVNRNKLSGGQIAGITVGSSILALLILIVIIFFTWRSCRNREILPVTQTPPFPHSPAIPTTSSDQLPVKKDHDFLNRTKIKYTESKELVFFGEDAQFFSLDELLNSSAEVIGKGTVGSTYKAYYDGGGEVIVKRVKNVCVSEDQFRAKIEDFGSLVHENLYPLKGYYYGRDEKLLFYDQNHKGSLSAHIHGNKNPLPWEVRLKIATGAAAGIHYLHSITPQTVHGNIKSSNIFLSETNKTLLSEHGLITLVTPRKNKNWYRAPEVIESGNITQKSDVYSFGIVLLELLTGKSPEQAEKEQGTDLVNWVQSVIDEEGEIEALHPNLVRLDSDAEEECTPFLHLAIFCTSQEPQRRPSMAEILQRFHEIKVLNR